MSDERLIKYARLLIELGVNVKKDQYLIIEAPVDAYPLVQACTKIAFERKAKDVVVFYTDAYVDKQRCLNVDHKLIEEVLPWQKESRVTYLKEKACSLLIKSAYPYLYSEVTSDASGALQRFTNNLRNNIRQFIATDNIQWCIASYPNQLWANTLFPNDDNETALEKMFDVIYDICRVRFNEDPLENWKEHLKAMAYFGKKLDSFDLDRLHFTNSLGTNLTIGLHPNAKFAKNDTDEIAFVANIPTEEISTSPDKYRVDGIVYASLPLEVGGAIIEDFGFTFKDGKVIDHFAAKNKQLLDQLLDTDEGSRYLGEVALVENKTPISQSGLLFYNTLYDENASCHLALGKGFPGCIEGCSHTDLKDWQKHNLNYSTIHIDFMFGTADMNITGYNKQNEAIPIFVDGNFAF